MNQIVSLATLASSGKAREIPVFGFIGDFFVVGVIDEVERRALPDTATPDHQKISFYFSSPRARQGLFVVDSKTRRTPSMPKDEYTVAVRYLVLVTSVNTIEADSL